VSGRSAFVLALAIVVAGSILRLTYLDADPDYYAWAGYITDEGRWVAYARDLALFGGVGDPNWLLRFHLILAPLFQAISYVAFALLGVSVWSARLPSALAGCLLLGLFWLALRRAMTTAGLLVGLLLLSLDVDLIELSRLSVPEMAAMLGQLAVYALLVGGRLTRARMFGAGLLLACTIAIKATVLPAVAVFSVIALFLSIEGDRGRALRHLAVFWAGLFSPSLLLVPAGVACCWRSAWVGATAYTRLQSLFSPQNLYGAVSFFFGDQFAPTLNAWSVGAIFAVVVLATSAQDPAGSAPRRHLLCGGIWCSIYGPIMLSLDYFPDRYRVHLLVPLAIMIAAGVTLAQRARPATAQEASRRLSGGWAFVLLAVLTLPTAALSAPALARLLAQAGFDLTRLHVKLASVLIAEIATAWLARGLLFTSRPPRFLLVFPILAVVVWMVCWRLGLAGGRFWPDPTDVSIGWWSVGTPIAGALALGLVAFGRKWSRQRWIGLAVMATACYAALAVARIAPAYLTPRYTIAETSRDLGRLLAESVRDNIATANAEGLFNGNALPYRSIVGRTWPSYRPDVLVTVFVFNDPLGLLEREYRPIARYHLYTSPEAARPADVRVYRRETLQTPATARIPERAPHP
jgi:hypothetical protein